MRRPMRGMLLPLVRATSLVVLLAVGATASAAAAVAPAQHGLAAVADTEAEEAPAAPDGADPTGAPDETPTPTPTPSDSDTPEPTPTPTPTSASTSPAEPTPTESEAPSPTPTPDPTATSPAAPAIPPAITTSSIPLPTLLIAIGVLLASGAILWLLLRGRSAPTTAPPLDELRAAGVPTATALDGMAALGTAMIDSGYPVGHVRSALEDMARSNGVPTAQAVVFPTSILVSVGDGTTAQTRAVTAGDSAHLLYQVDRVDHIAGVARHRSGAAVWVRRRLDEVSGLPRPFSSLQRIVAYGLLSAALSVLLGSSWLGVGLAGLLGLGAGSVLLATEKLAASYQALVVVAVSLGTSLIVLVVAHTLDPGVLPSIVAPLVMLLPGGLLTIAVIELCTGQIVSGAARLAAGAMRLLLLATGIVAASALLGIPAISSESAPLGPVAPWIAVAVFGVGICVYQCARRASIGWILIVLYVAYGAQVLGALFFDGVLSALVGAAAMTPVAVLVARQPSAPPALVSFLPAFWLLVPGALGLIGVATLLDGNSTGTDTIITTIATMVSIALGVLVGLGVTGAISGFPISPIDEAAEPEPEPYAEPAT